MRKILTLAVLLISVLVSGCTKKETTKQAMQPGEVYQFHIWTTDNEAFWSAVAQEFITQSGVLGVRMKVVEFPDDITLQNTLVSAMAEGKGPDAVLTNGQWIYQNYNKLIAAPQAPGLTPELFRSVFVRATHEPFLDGQDIYGLPVAVDTLGLYYNDDHIVERLPIKNEPSATWQGLLEDATKLTKADNSLSRFFVSGLALGRVDNIRYTTDVLRNIWLQRGVQLFTPDYTTATFATTQGIDNTGQKKSFGVEALEYITSFADPRMKQFSWSELMADPASQDKEIEAFATGKTSMIFGYASDYERIKTAINERTGNTTEPIPLTSVRSTFLPQVTDPSRSVGRKVVGEVTGFVVPRSAEKPELSWDLLQFIIKENILDQYWKRTQKPSPRVEQIVAQGAEPVLGVFAKQAKFAEFIPNPAGETMLTDGLIKVITALNNGEISATKGLRELESSMTETVRNQIQIQRAIKKEEDTAPEAVTR